MNNHEFFETLIIKYKELKLLKLHLIILSLFMFGCQTNNLVQGLKNDYAPETQAIVFNKYEKFA